MTHPLAVAAAEPAVLDVLSFPLRGSRLIEASAGTGKTWTIAALVLRLVLGHGGPGAAFSRPLLPAEVLVMTFTRAATRELSDRIRARLVEAARCFRGDADPAPDDDMLQALLQAHPAGPAREAAAWRLACAAEQMDDAAVHTIDAWCQRMLREHAFDSGCAFDEELAADESALQRDAARDVWRQQVYPLDGAVLDTVLAIWPNADALANSVRPALQQAGTGTDGPATTQAPALSLLVPRLLEARHQALATLKQGWAERAEALRNWLDAQLAPKDSLFNKAKLQARYYNPWLNALVAWANDPQAVQPALSQAAIDRLSAVGLHAAFKDERRCALHPHIEALEQLLAALRALPDVALAVGDAAALLVAQRLADIKAAAGRFGFADMLVRLDAALDPARNGDAAGRLRQRILQQTPVALVDEFQDTSPLQARIFDSLFRIASNDPDTALLLIGDPKQSIYAFRGADIRSYLQARGATQGRHHILGTNHRSTVGVVAAVNQLFAHAEASQPGGAFLYRDPGTGPRAGAGTGQGNDASLPFVPVAARGRPERCVTRNGLLPALQLELDAELQTAQALRERCAARCAEEIASLLIDSAAGFTTPVASPALPPAFQRLRPHDMAVLVPTGREAALVRRELRLRGVASVYLSDRDSVFNSREARDLWHWLRAVAEPRDVRLARAALATATVGLPLAELLQLAHNDEAFDARSEQLRLLHATWQGQGVLAMLRQTLHLLGLPARWLATDSAGQAAGEGERRLTNVLHMAELLQVASSQLDGEQALIRWLDSQIADGGAASGDDQVLRLESDADLVQVVTVHRSKGLEYPLVFLPFASLVRRTDKPGRPGQPAQQGNDDDEAADPSLDSLRENLRLLYVALTRARHGLWVGLAALKQGQGNSSACAWPRSAIGHLLSGEAAVLPEAIEARIRTAKGDCADITLRAATPLRTLPRSLVPRRGPQPPLHSLPPYAADFDRRWSVGSFSALLRDLPPAGAPQLAPQVLLDDEALAPDVPGDAAESSDAADPNPDPLLGRVATPATPAMPVLIQGQSLRQVQSSEEAPWHSFPRGALAGNFLHDQLEWLACEGFDLNDNPARQQQLLARCERQGWAHRAPDVLAWMRQVLATPLPPLGAPLQAVRSSLPEMEFWCPSDTLHTQRLDAWCREHVLRGVPRPSLAQRSLRGMLMGFADLVFEHAGRFWVLDHKSNHLGSADRDYTPAALAQAMAEHRYDVQAALYLLALHRLLRSRLRSDYAPAQHLGGALYVFLRGVAGPAGGVHWVAPATAALDTLDALLDAGAAP